MSKFIMECPSCHGYVQASTGFFARKRISCACGNVIDVKADRMASRICASCGNSVVFDQSRGSGAKCPVCRAKLQPDGAPGNMVSFRCVTCGCALNADPAAASVTCPVCDTANDVQAEKKKEEQRKKGLPSVIKYEGDNRTFVWKYPMEDFVTGSQLLVHESQEAIFFRNGEALDSFGPGRHTLETGILPLLDGLYRLPTGGAQPFHAEVYFVNLTTQMGIKWGTPSKIGLFDPATGLHVELGASGSFNLRVCEPRKLVIRLVGTTCGLARGDLFRSGTVEANVQAGGLSASVTAQVDGGYFRTMVATKVKANLARVIKENKLNVLELDEHVDMISSRLKDAIAPELSEYGLELTEFYVANIVTPDDDPNFRRMKQQHAELYLRTREEEIRKAEAEAAFERRAVEAQTEARMRTIGAQGEADALRIKAQAEAEAYRLKAEAEAAEMRMKGYTYQQETARQVGTEAMRNGGAAGGMGAVAGDAMQLGVGLGVMGSVVGMARDAVQPLTGQMAGIADPNAWDCGCGQRGITSRFCPSCGAKKPEPAAADTWDCACGMKGLTGRFCPECGAKKPEPPKPWDCACGSKGILGKFCPECGTKRPETWDCECGRQGIGTRFCPECGKSRP